MAANPGRGLPAGSGGESAGTGGRAERGRGTRGGGVRPLGIPTVLDRLIQQALLEVLTPVFDPAFSEHSYGFRPGRSAHDAVEAARRYVEEGYGWVVDLDIEKFFDRVNHDVLMARVARRVRDKRVLRLIRRYLQAGVMVEGVAVRTDEGTPQGGPLSPLLANILLDELDKELERRGHRFVRYADDCRLNHYLRGWLAYFHVADALSALEDIEGWLHRRLRACVWSSHAPTGSARGCLTSLKAIAVPAMPDEPPGADPHAGWCGRSGA